MSYTYTFIIPHHNSPELLSRCLESIPQRDDIQIIVIDDNSNDDKKPYVCRHEVELIFIDAEHTKGAGHARNIGIEKAKGKWLLFADCDDYYANGFINILDKYKNSDLSVLYYSFEYRDGKTKELLEALPFQNYIENYDETQNSLVEVKFHHKVPWTKMVRRSFVNDYNIRFEEVPNGNDIWFSMQVGFFADKINVEKSRLYVYLRNEGSISTQRRLKKSAYLCKIEHVFKMNELYRYLGHEEWCKSTFKFILSLIKNDGRLFLWVYLWNYIRIYTHRKDWVNYFCARSVVNIQ